MSDIIGESINGAKYRCYKKPDGNWSDPFAEHDFYSRTFMPTGTEKIEAQEEAEMVTKIKAVSTIKFKPGDLSTATKVILSREKIDLVPVIIKPIDDKIIKE